MPGQKPDECSPAPRWAQAAASEIVFVGVAQAGYMPQRFVVTKIVRGARSELAIGQVVAIDTPHNTCGFNFVVGRKYLIYASGDPLMTTRFNGTSGDREAVAAAERG